MPGPSKLKCHELFNCIGMSTHQVAQNISIKRTTIIIYLAECAAVGFPMRWDELCGNSRPGATGSLYFTADEIMKAITTCKNEGHELTSLVINMNRVRAELLETSSNQKVLAQESVQSAGFIIYAQIKTSVAMMTQNIQPQEWNEFIPNHVPFEDTQGIEGRHCC